MGEKTKILTHLENDYTEPIRDPVWKHIYLSRPLINLIQCKEFQNLHHIKQLGPAYLVYPGATHTRFNHSLGVFHLAKQMILRLLKSSPSLSLTLEGVKAFLCAALFHDLGHYPFAHSLKELSVRNHESLTREKILSPGLSSRIKQELSIDPETVAGIIDRDYHNHNNQSIVIFRNLLSGVLDPDKLDYLNRDAFFCGIPYGRQDVDYIMNDIHPHTEKGFTITEQGLSSVESLLFSKYIMYKTVYWHKTVRIATAMVKKAIFLGLTHRIIQPEHLYHVTDHSLFALAQQYNFPPFTLLTLVSSRILYKQVFSAPFNPHNPSHEHLEKLEARIGLENIIAEELSKKAHKIIHPEDIIIDIPERISFEIDVPVLNVKGGEEIRFQDSGSVFTPETISNFVRTLRHISISVKRDDSLLEAVKGIDLEVILRDGVA
ncbi:MAG: HD domain-containing protein [Spirochaetales bacterium]|nr:HD domain-containing protein [Spirochaetales bacterium]